MIKVCLGPSGRRYFGHRQKTRPLLLMYSDTQVPTSGVPTGPSFLQALMVSRLYFTQVNGHVG